MNDDIDPRAGLLAAKLGALVRGRWADVAASARPGTFPGGATLLDAEGGRVWILLDEDADRRLGAALAVAQRAQAAELHLLVDDAVAGGVLARRAALFADGPTVWAVTGRELSVVEPAPPAVDPAPSPGAELYRPVLTAAGLEAVVEDGNLLGELLGLEVARVVADDADVAHIEVGVGRFDREVGAMMFAELAEADALSRAIDFVAAVRAPDAQRHPLNQLVPERWLRAVIVADPGLVGAAHLRSVGSAVPRRNLKEPGVATAVGEDLDGRPLVVTCSTGVDLELVPSAADDRFTHAPGARLVLAVPSRDALPVTTELAHHLVQPAEVVPVADAWRDVQPGGAG
ncbi:hypothetical protein [Aquihabitans sp. McL0605]|uniref:hypothetical protein n=1 Tax=Aquihabitans sp. McL0605 TaxID=3415671 RepID=UPI003CEC8DD9